MPVTYTYPQYAYMYFPSLEYNMTDNLKLTLGAVIIDGNEANLLGEFHKHDQFFAKLRMSF